MSGRAVRIDAHHHFWRLSAPAEPAEEPAEEPAQAGFDYRWLDAPALAAIRRDRMPEDLAPLLAAAGVDASIVVQTQHRLAENDWALGLADRHPFVAGVVGWVDLAADDVADRAAEYAARPKFVGVRHVVQDEPDDDFIVRPAVLRGLKALERAGLPFDLLFYARHLRHAATLARELPSLPMVVDHLAKPPIKDQVVAGWREDLRAAAAFPNVFCKLSGLVTEADWRAWTVADLRPYVDAALEAFGPARCMYGSDWPVCELAADYGRVHAAAAELIAGLSPAEQADVWGGTARRFYRLGDRDAA